MFVDKLTNIECGKNHYQHQHLQPRRLIVRRRFRRGRRRRFRSRHQTTRLSMQHPIQSNPIQSISPSIHPSIFFRQKEVGQKSFRLLFRQKRSRTENCPTFFLDERSRTVFCPTLQNTVRLLFFDEKKSDSFLSDSFLCEIRQNTRSRTVSFDSK